MVRARHVVLAGSTGTGAVDEQLAETVQPITTYVAVTAPLGERLFEAVSYNGAVADTRRAGDYYRVVGDDRLMWGGRIPAPVGAAQAQSADAQDMLAVYPQLGDVEIEHAWSGIMAYAVHKMPQIGELAQGYWLASAFGGHGLNTTAMAGEMIARAILEGDDRWRLFSPYELVWAGGRAGRIAAQTMLWSMRVRDALKEKLARYRDRARREADARQIRYEAEGRACARRRPKGRVPTRRRDGSPSRKHSGLLPRRLRGCSGAGGAGGRRGAVRGEEASANSRGRAARPRKKCTPAAAKSRARRRRSRGAH